MHEAVQEDYFVKKLKQKKTALQTKNTEVQQSSSSCLTCSQYIIHQLASSVKSGSAETALGSEAVNTMRHLTSQNFTKCS